MAKRVLRELPHEVAQIVLYIADNPNPIVVRYCKMETAEKQFNVLAARNISTRVTLNGDVATCVIPAGVSLSAFYLVDVENSNLLVVDTQRRFQAMQQVPL